MRLVPLIQAKDLAAVGIPYTDIFALGKPDANETSTGSEWLYAVDRVKTLGSDVMERLRAKEHQSEEIGRQQHHVESRERASVAFQVRSQELLETRKTRPLEGSAAIELLARAEESGKWGPAAVSTWISKNPEIYGAWLEANAQDKKRELARLELEYLNKVARRFLALYVDRQTLLRVFCRSGVSEMKPDKIETWSTAGEGSRSRYWYARENLPLPVNEGYEPPKDLRRLRSIAHMAGRY